MTSEDNNYNLDNEFNTVGSLYDRLIKMNSLLAPKEPVTIALSRRHKNNNNNNNNNNRNHHYSRVNNMNIGPELEFTHRSYYSDDDDNDDDDEMRTQVHTINNNNNNNNSDNNNNNGHLFSFNSHHHSYNHNRPGHLNGYHHRVNHRNKLKYSFFTRKFTKKWRILTNRFHLALRYGVIALIGVITGVILFNAVFKTPTLTGEDVLLLSSDCSKSDQFCITSKDINRDLEVASVIEIWLSNQAGYYECGNTNYNCNFLTKQQLIDKIRNNKFKIEIPENELWTAFEHSLWLFIQNPHWGIKLTTTENIILEKSDTDLRWKFENEEIILFSTKPYKPLHCQVRLLVFKFILMTWKYLILIIAIVILFYTLYSLYKKKLKDFEDMFMVIDKILNIMRIHYDKTKELSGTTTSYKLVCDVRDLIFNNTERNSKKKLWDAAIDWLNRNDSRLKTEIKNINGKDFHIWRWIQIDPKPHFSQEVAKRKSQWQGGVLDDYPPGVAVKVAPPNGSPSKSFRIKNVFKPNGKLLDYETAYNIEWCMLDQCIANGKVLHIHVDRKSKMGCVFVKMDTVQGAVYAYRALHGAWFQHNMLIVDFIPENSYNKLFKKSITAVKPIYPPM